MRKSSVPLFFCLSLAAGVVADAGVIVEYPIPATGLREPVGMAKGSDGNVWFSMMDASEIVRITPAGEMTEFGLPGVPDAITNGPDGALWFTYGAYAAKIGRLTTSGDYTDFSIPVANSYGQTWSDITTGPDGNLWYVGSCDNNVYRMTTLGQVRGFPVSGFCPYRLAAGPDGNLWISLHYAPAIAKMAVNGADTEYALTAPNDAPLGIAAGPDGNVWFLRGWGCLAAMTTSGNVTSGCLNVRAGGDITAGPDGYMWVTGYSATDTAHSAIERVDLSGNTVGDFPTSAGNSAISLRRIVAGGDSRLWFGETDVMKIGALSTTGILQEFPILLKRPAPGALTKGPDGNVWFVETDENKIGRITPDGTITEFPVPTPASKPLAITAGPDGAVWFTESNADNLGRIAQDGTITEFQVATLYGNPGGIALGPDGNLWYTLSAADRIGKMTPTGTPTEFAAGGTSLGLNKLVAGPDGKLWAAGSTTTMVRMSTTGVVDVFSVPLFNAPLAITSGPDGNVWANSSDGFARITPALQETKFNMNYPVAALTAGPDGAIWGTAGVFGKVLRMTASGSVTLYPVPFTGANLSGITVGSDGNIWFAESSSGRIGKLPVDKPIAATGHSMCLSGTDFSGAVASFTDADTASSAGEFAATIDWGDGTSTTGTIQQIAPGAYDVIGQHTYRSATEFSVQTTITDGTNPRDVGGNIAIAVSTTKYAWIGGVGGSFCSFDVQTATANPSNATSFLWSIDGADILSGQGTSTIRFRAYRTGSTPITATLTVGSCSETATITANATVCALLGGDISGDGRSDVVWHDPATGESTLWVMRGSDTPITGSLPTVADPVWRVAAEGDFDGDGHSDLMWWNPATGGVAVWLMDNFTVRSAAIVTTVPDLHWRIVGVGDLDHDFSTDVLWRNETTGQVVAWLMDGTTIKSVAVIATVPDLNWEIGGVGDFNGDRIPDVFWHNGSTGQNVVWFMSGAASISSAVFSVTVPDTQYTPAAIGDLDHDGKADIVWWNRTTGNVVVWLMNGSDIASAKAVTRVSDTNWHIEADGDFDGDFKTDLFWRNVTTGDAVVWLMNGTQLVQAAHVGSVTDVNWIVVAPR